MNFCSKILLYSNFCRIRALLRLNLIRVCTDSADTQYCRGNMDSLQSQQRRGGLVSLSPSQTPRSSDKSVRDLRSNDSNSSKHDKDKGVNVQVIVRCRPLSEDEMRVHTPVVISCNDGRREVSAVQSIANKQIDRTFLFDKREERETGGNGKFLDGIIEAMPVFAKELVAGGVAGGVAKSAVAPLERVKILFQTRRGEFQSMGLLGSIKKIAKTEGVLGFYRGNGASVARIVPYAALHYMAYEQYRRWIILSYPDVGRGPVLDLVAGSFAGGTAVLFTYPLDLVRTKLAYQVVDSSKMNLQGLVRSEQVYKGIVDCFSKTYKESGLRGLYRGVAPSLYGIFPYAGLKFYFYEEMKLHVPEEDKKNIMVKLVCGSVAGLLGQTFTYPLDVVRRQMQVERLATSNSAELKGTMESLVMIVQKQGWKQLFSGLSINYLKVVPSVAIGFTIYDVMKLFLRVPSRDDAVIEVVTNKRNSQPSLHSS